MILAILASVWMLAIPLTIVGACAVGEFFRRRAERHTDRDDRDMGILLSFDPDRVPARRRHG